MVVLAPRVYTPVNCPNGHEVARVLEHVVVLGQPEKACPTCGVVVAIPQFREWPQMTDAQRRAHVRGVAMGTIFSGCVLGVLIGVCAMVVGMLADLPDAAGIALFFVGLVAGFALVILRQVAKVRRSIERTNASPVPGAT
jgi:hypothetical protein